MGILLLHLLENTWPTLRRRLRSEARSSLASGPKPLKCFHSTNGPLKCDCVSPGEQFALLLSDQGTMGPLAIRPRIPGRFSGGVCDQRRAPPWRRARSPRAASAGCPPAPVQEYLAHKKQHCRGTSLIRNSITGVTCA